MSETQATPNQNPFEQIGRVLLVSLALLIVVVVSSLFTVYTPNRPVDYLDAAEHFKYGSIRTVIENGLPLKVLQALPRMFPEYLPEGTQFQDYRAV